MSMYKRPPLRVREDAVASGRPKTGSFLDAIVNPPPTTHPSHPKKPIYQKDAYLSLLKRSYEDVGLAYKEPNIPDYVARVTTIPPGEPELSLSDRVYLRVRILKSGIIRIKLDTSFANLYEKYYSKCKQPPMTSIIQAYKSMGFSLEFLDKIKIKFSKFADHKKKVQEKIDSVFNKEPAKKPKKIKKKEDEEPMEEIEEDDDEDEEDEDPDEDGGMDVEVDEDPDEQPQEGEEEAYLSD